MNKTFNCPMPGCNHVISVEADSPEIAVGMIMKAGGEHAEEVHPGMPMDLEELEKMVREAVKQ